MDWQVFLGWKVDVLMERGVSPLIREQILAKARSL